MKNKNSLSVFGALILVAMTSLMACQNTQKDPAGAASGRWNDREESLSFKTIRKARSYVDAHSSARTLILPIEFTDYPHTKLYGEKRETDGAREDIYNVNFGASEDTQWESLKSYYYKSSYGQTNLTGGVAPWFNPWADNILAPDFGQDYNVKNFAADHSGYNGADFALDQALDYIYNDGYKEEFITTDGIKTFESGKECLQYFDENRDGLIDNIQLVYTCPPHVKDASGKAIDDQLFWAFRSMLGPQGANVEKPKANNFLWLSYETFFENANAATGEPFTEAEKIACVNVLDAHTLIHETGHALGAEDYYTESSKDTEAAGGFIMMSNNVADHDPWTKLLYGWTNPQMVYKPTTITVNKFEADGDSIVVPIRYTDSETGARHTVADEYLVIDYYTPDGLNEFDHNHQYTGAHYPTGSGKSGVAIWHIDARLATFSLGSSAYEFGHYTDVLESVTSGFTYFGAFNDIADAKEAKVPDTSLKLMGIINVKDSAKNAKFSFNAKTGKFFDDDNLLYAGEVLECAKWKMNNGKNFGYNIKVVSITDTTATIQFY